MTTFRIGYGYDVHQFKKGRELWIGGILIPHDRGLDGHSDADVLLHAICDALLGAANLRDIGYHFPPSDATLAGVDSKRLLRQTIQLVRNEGYELGNIDATICAEAPKMNPHIPAMQQVIAEVMGVATNQISIKATTTERLGFVGKEEGLASHAVALLTKEV